MPATSSGGRASGYVYRADEKLRLRKATELAKVTQRVQREQDCWAGSRDQAVTSGWRSPVAGYVWSALGRLVGLAWEACSLSNCQTTAAAEVDASVLRLAGFPAPQVTKGLGAPRWGGGSRVLAVRGTPAAVLVSQTRLLPGWGFRPVPRAVKVTGSGCPVTSPAVPGSSSCPTEGDARTCVLCSHTELGRGQGPTSVGA